MKQVPRRPQNGTQAHDMSRELRFEERLLSALPRFGTAGGNSESKKTTASVNH